MVSPENGETSHHLRYLRDEYALRLQEQKHVPNVLAHAFNHQIRFIKDPAKQKALFCTRRSAKSFTAGLYLVYEAMANPGCNCLFIGLTRASAKAIIWKDILNVIDKKYGLNLNPNQTDLTMTLPNGSVIAVTGVDADEREMNKLLGRKYRLVCIDEASMYTIDLRNLVYGVLLPAVTDPNESGESGTIALFGTASDFPRGLFYDITTRAEKGWELFQWTAHDNPYVAKQWQAALNKIREERPSYMETPQYKQWFLNQWVIDEEKLVYRFDINRNLVDSVPNLPRNGWSFVLGVDTGWEDDSAFVLSGFHINDPRLFIFRVYKRKKMTFDDVVQKINEFFDDIAHAPNKVIIDGANKQGVESMRQRSEIPFEYADKQDKVTFIELCNSDLIQGKIVILNIEDNRSLWLEMASLVWVTDGEKIKYPKKEHPSLPNHLCFVAGTMIQTPKGERPIETLKIGDYVETRRGPRRIQNTIGRRAYVISLEMSDGSKITCTSDHPFWSEGKWKSARNLTTTDRLFSWKELQNQKESHLRENFTIALSELNISKRFQRVKQRFFIGKYGRMLTAPFRKVGTFITRIMMPSITDLRTWNVYPQVRIKELIAKRDPKGQAHKRDCSILPRSGHLQRLGTRLQKGALGTKNMEKHRSHLWEQYAPGVEQSILSHTCTKQRMDAVPQDALPLKDAPAGSTISDSPAHGAAKRSSQINMSNENAVVCVAQDLSKRIEYVYNITVEEEHEYFANGFLVSNCDAFLYSWRCGYHYSSSPAVKTLVVGSREWYMKQSDNMWEREREHLQRVEEWGEEGTLGDLE